MRWPLILSLLLNAVLVVALVVIGGRANRVVSGLIDHAQKAKERRVDAMNATRVGSADIVLLGDSLTWEGSWDEYFPNQQVVNRGVGGDQVDDLAARFDAVVAHDPGQLVFMAGINDLNFGRDVRAIIQSYESLFDRIDTDLPGTAVVLQSVLPTNGDWVIAVDPADVEALNHYLWAEAAERGWRYLDLTPLFSDEQGQLTEELSNDGIHLKGEGYRIWRDALGPILVE
ncbi:MAG: GDSL-type esterase/lipase family protein [Pseudomonadota bacterium]